MSHEKFDENIRNNHDGTFTFQKVFMMIKSKVEVKEKDARDTTVPWVTSLLIFNSVSSGKQGNLKHGCLLH